MRADIYGYKQPLTTSMVVSAALHAGVVAFLFLVPALLSRGGMQWGNNGSGAASGGAMSAHLVSGIPLPPNPQANPQNVLANESKGLSQSRPAPAPKVEEKNAIPIPERQAKVKPHPEKERPREQAEVTPPPHPLRTPAPPVATPTQQQPLPKTPAPMDNVVPYGEGGPVAGPYTSLNIGNSSGGLKFGEGGTGTFGSLYGWYADVVARKVHQAWESEVSPNVMSANRVYLVFDISRSGKPYNIRIEQSSGIPWLDQSALDTLKRIDTFGPLPGGYSGSSISVEFWFDYRR